MTPILQQFLSEARDFLQGIGQSLLKLEKAPDDAELMSDLFRSVHTLKGNSGLFEFPEMSRVLHAAEDVMSEVREDRLAFSEQLADRLLDAMDFVAMLLDGLDGGVASAAAHAAASVRFADSLRELIRPRELSATDSPAGLRPPPSVERDSAAALPLDAVPEGLRSTWADAARRGEPLHWIIYTPAVDCFFKGEDPLHQARQTAGLEWQRVTPTAPWATPAELDPYQCVLRFDLVSAAAHDVLADHFRYVPEEVVMVPLTLATLLPAAADPPADSAAAGPAGAGTVAGGAAPATAAIVAAIVAAQVSALQLADVGPWVAGRLRAIAATLSACYRSIGREQALPALEAALGSALIAGRAAPLAEWLATQPEACAAPALAMTAAAGELPAVARTAPLPADAAASGAGEAAAGRRPDDGGLAATVLKVDQEKIDKLMNLIGEMVVAKNGLPFLAARAESVYGVRELAREIKAQYAVINRIAEEMQDAIMQVRMMPVSGVFQRFPRLVRDISRKLGKEVRLTLEGETTEADKNIIEALADPLIHIVRNSLDHGIEAPAARRSAGKPAEGQLTIRASQDSGRVLIDISDDGKGIDPAVVKLKAYEKGLIDEAMLERISDQDAINLVFAAGFSTAETVSDLSGRGVGMDVVRNAVERVNGSVTLSSVPGAGTMLRLSLPLSMAVTNVMVIESNKQIFGVPMDMVLETVRVPRSAIRMIKNRQTMVLRNRILPLRSLNEMLAENTVQVSNDQDEMATLVVQIHGESLGIMVDDFREVVDIILKPMGGILNGVPGYSGSALLGDGSVLMVLNPKELVTWQ